MLTGQLFTSPEFLVQPCFQILVLISQPLDLHEFIIKLFLQVEFLADGFTILEFESHNILLQIDDVVFS